MKWPQAKSAIVAACIVVLAAANGLSQTKATTSASSSGKANSWASGGFGNGEHLHVSGDIPVGFDTRVNGVKVTFGSAQIDAKGNISFDHELTIEPERVLLDGKEQAKISASATDFEVTCIDRQVSVEADKKLVFAAKLKK